MELFILGILNVVINHTVNCTLSTVELPKLDSGQDPKRVLIDELIEELDALLELKEIHLLGLFLTLGIASHGRGTCQSLLSTRAHLHEMDLTLGDSPDVSIYFLDLLDDQLKLLLISVLGLDAQLVVLVG